MVWVCACWQHPVLDSHWWNKLAKRCHAHCRPFLVIFCKLDPGPVCEDIYLPKLLICQPRAKADTVKGEACPFLVRGRWPSSSSVPYEAYLPPAVHHFKREKKKNFPRFSDMLITVTGLNPGRFTQHPRPLAISIPMVCLTAVRLGRGDKCVCLWEMEMKKKERLNESKGGKEKKKKKRGESEADGAEEEM